MSLGNSQFWKQQNRSKYGKATCLVESSHSFDTPPLQKSARFRRLQNRATGITLFALRCSRPRYSTLRWIALQCCKSRRLCLRWHFGTVLDLLFLLICGDRCSYRNSGVTRPASGQHRDEKADAYCQRGRPFTELNHWIDAFLPPCKTPSRTDKYGPY